MAVPMMYRVRENRNLRQTSCLPLSILQFIIIFALCISVYVIFVITSEKDPEFNAKNDKDKWTFHLDNDIIKIYIYGHKITALINNSISSSFIVGIAFLCWVCYWLWVYICGRTLIFQSVRAEIVVENNYNQPLVHNMFLSCIQVKIRNQHDTR